MGYSLKTHAPDHDVTSKPDYGAFRSKDPGQDLSGSLQGAGGVGGLLMLEIDGTNCFTCFDGNGNVMALVGASDGTIVAEYEYGPFGETLKADGQNAKANPFRVSTKQVDPETGWVYVNQRWYIPELGRFASKDPIGEAGGVNLYVGCGNDMVDFFDPYGLRQEGHHIIPEGIWKAVFGEKLMGPWNDALDTVDGVIDTVDHDFTGHREYNTRIAERIEEYLSNKGISRCCVTKENAKEILKLIKNSSDPYISGFNSAIRTGGKAGLENWLAEGAREIAKAERAAIKAAQKASGSSVAAELKYVKYGGKIVKVILIGTFIYTATEQGVQAATEQTFKDLIFADEIMLGYDKGYDWAEKKTEFLSMELRAKQVGIEKCDLQ